ncbi:hypothetical protein LJC13_00780 [Peptostreptococcaceae bacterium OttesenSCG-928-C18]|nr:hypothetical protein [Peptostreptococcaceae bacterium OttesenSCG-928-C18]
MTNEKIETIIANAKEILDQETLEEKDILLNKLNKALVNKIDTELEEMLNDRDCLVDFILSL